MSKTGVANLPLHGGKAPKWLFNRMVKLSKGIIEVILYEYGKDEFITRLSDPFWFQCLSCVLGFDWHSSGTTTVTCGALKEAIDPEEYGFAILGGKGKASKKTPEEILITGENYNFSTKRINELQHSSRMAAKVDNSAIQDGHNLYHHSFLLSETGTWGVIQQGLNDDTNYARRYHWLSKNFDNFLLDSHNGIIGEKNEINVLDMATKDSLTCQKTCVDLVNDHPRHLIKDWANLSIGNNQTTLDQFCSSQKNKIKNVQILDMPRSIHWNKMKEIYDFQPKNYEELLSLKGVGPKTIRALALISELIYGDKPSWKDPVKYTFTVGGKDGIPYPVDRKTMDQTTEILNSGVIQAKIGDKDKIYAIERLKNFTTVIQ